MKVGGTVQRLNTMQYNELAQLETCWFSYFLLIESTKDQGMNNGKPPRSRQTAEIYARSCKAQCFTSLFRLGLAEQSFFGKDLSRIVLYKQRRFEGGAALQDFQLFDDSPRAHAPRSSHGLRSQPGDGWEEFLFSPERIITNEDIEILQIVPGSGA